MHLGHTVATKGSACLARHPLERSQGCGNTAFSLKAPEVLGLAHSTNNAAVSAPAREKEAEHVFA
jgi:hypothetical protein